MNLNNFILFSLRVYVTIVILVACNSVAFSSILKHIDVTESESYGDWTYTTIEFSDSLTILKGSFKAKSRCWIGSNRDESLEVNGKKMFVIENDLPYSIEKKVYDIGDSIAFTYIFEPISHIIGLHNVKHSRFILPVFFKPHWRDEVSKNALAKYYLNKAESSIYNREPYPSLRYLELYYGLSQDSVFVSKFLKEHDYHSNIETEDVISYLKIAHLFYVMNEFEECQKTLTAFDANYDIAKYVDKVDTTSLVGTLTTIINSKGSFNLPPEFLLFSIKFFESIKDYNTASDIAIEYNKKISNIPNKIQFVIHDAYLRSIDADSIKRAEINRQVESELDKSSYSAYYTFMYNRYKHLNEPNICVAYGDSLYNRIDEIDRPNHVNEFYDLAESYIKLKKYDKALFYHKAFEKYSILLSPSGQSMEELIDLRLSNSIRFINLSDYPSVVLSTEHNKDWLCEVYGEDSEEYANNVFYNAIGYNGIGNTDKANENFTKAYNLLKEIDQYSTFCIQSLYYLALNSMYEKDYVNTAQYMDEANLLFAHNNNRKLKQKLLRLEIELYFNTNKYEDMYIAMEELQKYLNEDPSIHDETFLNSTQGDFFLEQKMYPESLNMYSINEELLKNNSIDTSSDVFISCLSNQLNVYVSEGNNIQMIHSYAQRLWSSLKDLLLSSMGKLAKNERYKIVELYEEDLNLIQKSLILVNTAESNSLLYDILLFRKGLLLSTEVINENKENNYLNLSNFNYNHIADSLQAAGISVYDNSASLYSWRDVRNSLKSSSIAIEFIANKDSISSNLEYYSALVISKDCSTPVLLQLGKIPALLNSAEDLYNSSVLYDSIWLPIFDRFTNVRDVYFSADGCFHKTAIENAKLPSGILLKEEYNIHRVSSTKILTDNSGQDKNTSYVFYGGLFYDNYPQPADSSYNKTRCINANSLTSMDQLRGGIRYLPGSKREVETINAQMDSLNIDYTSYIGYDGTESSFRNLQNSKINVLHLATHGFFQEDEDLNDYDFKFLNNAKRQNFDFEDELLLKSGLFFAFANSTISMKSNLPEDNDGIITAKDLTKLDFSSADLVVLSACQTGLGTIRGEGVFGLQRGFKVSGALSLLMSLWPVDDEATQLLMGYFYNYFLNDHSKDESLMLAQNSIRNTAGFEDPDYWAGWILLDALN